MNTYEIERKLGDKVDKWELYGLQTENRELRRQVDTLIERVSRLESTNSSRYYVFERFFNILLEHPQFSELQNEIHQLKGELY